MSTYSYFPEAAGTEEETRVNIWRPAKGSLPAATLALDSTELSKLNRGIDKFCPTLPGSLEFRENGSRTYVDVGGVELAGGEVNNPIDQLVCVAAQARLLEKSLEGYTGARSRASGQKLAGIFQRRVIDNQNNTWGCHDNFSVQQPGYGHRVAYEGADAGHLWVGHLYSRVFITGAMLVGQRGSTFSQKLSVPHEFNKYGYVNSLLRTDTDHGQRLEIRCNDINLQDWAFLSRVGGAVLILAATQTPLGRKLANSAPFSFEKPEPKWNTIPLDDNLDLYAAKGLLRIIDMQHYVLSTILEKLEDYTNEAIPLIYREIGESILRYCNDIEAVAYGKKDLETLSSRTDWASKLMVVREHIRRDPSGRQLGDTKSKVADFLYDRVSVNAKPNGKVNTTYGYGHTLSASNSVLVRRSQAIEEAMHYPPQETRAAIRVHAAKRLGKAVTRCTWNALTVVNDKGTEKSVPLEKIRRAG